MAVMLFKENWPPGWRINSYHGPVTESMLCELSDVSLAFEVLTDAIRGIAEDRGANAILDWAATVEILDSGVRVWVCGTAASLEMHPWSILNLRAPLEFYA